MSAKARERSNAERFISTYNQIDHALRTIYGFKRNITFADLIRKAVPLSSVVRKYEDELIDYGRLRNSIVHKTNPNYVIAEPHEEVVADFEKIARLICTPPTAYDRVCTKEVLTCRSTLSVKEVLKLMAKTGHKNIPVYDNNVLKGTVIGSELLEKLGKYLLTGGDLQHYLEETNVIDIVSRPEETLHFRVADKKLTIERALNYFYLNRRLELIIITEHGLLNEKPLGVVTVADILDMNALLENY